MTTPFQFPYLVTEGTPAVAIEVQANFDALLSWIQGNYVQKDDSPGFDVNIAAPLISGLDNQVVQKSYVDNNVLPTGTILMWSGSGLPDADKWDWCRGGARSTTDPKYQPLFNVINFDYGDPGSGEFNLPDLQAKFPLGVNPGTIDEGATGGTTNVAQHNHDATFAGEALAGHNHTMPSHKHTMGSHSHGVGSLAVSSGGNHGHTMQSAGDHDHNIGNNTAVRINGGAGNPDTFFNSGGALENSYLSWDVEGAHTHTINNNGAHTHPLTGSTQSVDPGDTNDADPGDTNNRSAGTPAGTVSVSNKGDANDNRPPWQAVNYIIKL